MISREDLESFLIRTEMDHREIGESMWLVDPVKDAVEDHPAVVVSLSPPLVIFRSSIGTVPEGAHARLKLYQTLLELNATDLVHGAYGLEGDEVILVDGGSASAAVAAVSACTIEPAVTFATAHGESDTLTKVAAADG